jgi:DNA (cytosine-5)-methyltransferase 1
MFNHTPDRSIFRAKVQRLREGISPRILDLFAGCGGLSLGFHTAGYTTLGAVELDSFAVKSYALNFHDGNEKKSRARDITTTDPVPLIQELAPDEPIENAVDVIIGGPPCQSFARVGRAKLREVAQHPEAFRHDPRSRLYIQYLHFVNQLKPVVLLMENVPDILNYGGQNIAQEICDMLTEMGYVCRYTLLNAAYYGVPQMRERLFLIALAREFEIIPTFPEPTHWIDLPRGYEGSRQVALKYIERHLPMFDKLSFIPIPEPSHNGLPAAITVREAIGDLPPILLHLEGRLKKGARHFNPRWVEFPAACCETVY